MEHTLESHQSVLNNLCRVCGNMNCTNMQDEHSTYPVLCEDYSMDLWLFYRWNIKYETSDKHSRFLCYSCVSRMTSIKDTLNASALQEARDEFEKTNDIWCSYDPSVKTYKECSICEHYGKMMRRCFTLDAQSRKEQSGVISSKVQQSLTTEYIIENDSANDVTKSDIDMLKDIDGCISSDDVESTKCNITRVHTCDRNGNLKSDISLDDNSNYTHPKSEYTTHDIYNCVVTKNEISDADDFIDGTKDDNQLNVETKRGIQMVQNNSICVDTKSDVLLFESDKSVDKNDVHFVDRNYMDSVCGFKKAITETLHNSLSSIAEDIKPDMALHTNDNTKTKTSLFGNCTDLETNHNIFVINTNTNSSDFETGKKLVLEDSRSHNFPGIHNVVDSKARIENSSVCDYNRDIRSKCEIPSDSEDTPTSHIAHGDNDRSIDYQADNITHNMAIDSRSVCLPDNSDFVAPHTRVLYASPDSGSVNDIMAGETPLRKARLDVISGSSSANSCVHCNLDNSFSTPLSNGGCCSCRRDSDAVSLANTSCLNNTQTWTPLQSTNMEPSTAHASLNHDIDTFSNQTCHNSLSIHTSTPSILQPEKTTGRRKCSASKKTKLLETDCLCSLQKSVNERLSAAEETILTHLIKRKLNTASKNNLIRCKTGGQPLMLLRIVRPRKAFELLAARSKRMCRVVEGTSSSHPDKGEDEDDVELDSVLEELN